MFSRRAFLGTAAAATIAARPGFAQATKSIVTTTGMIADAAQAIAGDVAEVRALMGAGVDPHGYRQTRSDIVALTQADLVLWNGHYLEAQMEDFLLRLARRTTVVAVAEAAPEDQLLKHEDYAGRADPHLWMDPALWHVVVEEIAAQIAHLAPEQAQAIDVRAQTYLTALDEVGTYARDALDRVPAESRVLVTAHDAFGYFGRAYGFDVMGIQGISTESEAGLQRIGELVDLLVKRRVGAVFVESSVSDRNIRALIEGAAAQGHTVRIGGELYSDAMGIPGTYEGTYVGMVDHNATVIAGALGADVPPHGMSGKLSVEVI